MKGRNVVIGLVAAVVIGQLLTIQVLLLKNLQSSGPIEVKVIRDSAPLVSMPGPIEVKIVRDTDQPVSVPGPIEVRVVHEPAPMEPRRAAVQGNLYPTERTLDLAIDGHGYFQVLMPTGETAYTRNGALRLNSTGDLVTDDGYSVQPAITIPEGYLDVLFAPDGVVSAIQPGSPVPVNLGTLELVRFMNPEGLRPWRRNGMFLETEESGSPLGGEPGGTDGLGTIEQGFLETQFASSTS
jgi:flagellar basal body rod protein FlgG